MSASRLLTAAAAALAAAAAAVSAQTFSNPVIPNLDTPDPGAAYDPVTGLYWAGTTTGNAPDCFMLHSSPDLGHWSTSGAIFPQANRPAWIHDSCWAPELHFVGGQWLVYFVGRLANGLLSVGVGVSTTGKVDGPYADPLGRPLITDTGASAQGQIDPTFFVDTDGTPYLIWKTDGNADNQPTPIRIAKLTPNGTALAPGPDGVVPDWHTTQLITNDLPWEGAIVEAPWMVKYAQTYFLFYSANGYGNDYAVGVARASSITGPYTKLQQPILHNATVANPPFQASGHCSVLQAKDGNWAMVYHAWLGADRSARHMMVDPLVWKADGQGGVWPAMADGTATPGVGPQPVP